MTRVRSLYSGTSGLGAFCLCRTLQGLKQQFRAPEVKAAVAVNETVYHLTPKGHCQTHRGTVQCG